MKKVLSFLTCISLCSIIVLTNVTTPSGSGPFGVLAVFLSLYILCVCLLSYIVFSLGRLFAYISRTMRTKQPFRALDLRRSFYFSIILALGPIMLTGLQSVNAVNLYGIVLIGIFVIIGCLYIAKTT